MAYGGFTAGLKAGHVSDTWPLMLGRWVPAGLLSQVEPTFSNLVSAPLTVAWIHRWFAFGVLIAAVCVYGIVRRGMQRTELAKAVGLLVAMTTIQIALGIAIVISHVEIGIALLHQLNALGLFVVMLYLLHRLLAANQLDPRRPVPAQYV